MTRAALPNEVLLEILVNVPTQRLKEIALLSRFHCDLARRVLFAHVTLSAFRLAEDGSLAPLSASGQEKTIERLEFLFSGHIAPLVRSIDIKPIGPAFASSSYTMAAGTILDSWFANAYHFVGVHRLKAISVPFTVSKIRALTSMSSLRDLALVDCGTVSAEEGSAPVFRHLKLSNLSIYQVSAEDTPIIDTWIRALDPAHLQGLVLDCSSAQWKSNPPELPLFPHLHRAHFRVKLSEMDDILPVLMRFSTVKHLTISGSGQLTYTPALHPASSAPFPALKEFTGSPETLHIFVSGTRLMRLNVSSCYPQALITQLRAMPVQTAITHLSLALFSLDTSAFSRILSSFSELVELNVEVDDPWGEAIDNDYEAPGLGLFARFAEDVTHLPSDLTSLSLVRKCPRRYSDAGVATYKPAQARHALLGRCRHLREIYIDDGVRVLTWRKSGDGKVEEKILWS